MVSVAYSSFSNHDRRFWRRPVGGAAGGGGVEEEALRRRRRRALRWRRRARERDPAGLNLCENQPVRRVRVISRRWPSWLGRAVRNRHRRAIEQASRVDGVEDARRFSTNAP